MSIIIGYVVCIDEVGNELWYIGLFGFFEIFDYWLAVIFDGGYFVVGFCYVFNNVFYMVKLD